MGELFTLWLVTSKETLSGPTPTLLQTYHLSLPRCSLTFNWIQKSIFVLNIVAAQLMYITTRFP